jgi:penicillin amidase
MGRRAMVLEGTSGSVRITRDHHGVPQIEATSLADTQLGLGYCHARDRGLQMMMVRLLGRGRICECLHDNEEMLAVDRFFRRLGFSRDAEAEEAVLTPRARAGVEAYNLGVNAYFERAGLPWELRFLGCRFDPDDPWRFADVYLTAKVIGYVNLAQTQAEVERLIVECTRQGVDRERLEELFPGQLEGLDEHLVRQVQLDAPRMPEFLKWASALPRAAGSNNWVVAGSKTASGQAILASDPHLQVNRMPAVWYEAVLRWDTNGGRRYAMGATMPGTPGIIIGRTPDLAWGITYAYMDCIDSWIEDCRDGCYRRGREWVPFEVRREEIRRKSGPSEVIEFFENRPHGTLEGDPREPGYYLATRWSANEATGAAGLDGILGVLEATTVAEGRGLLGQVRNSSWNWVLADRDGHIGYQMAGKMPLRRPGVSGLVPLPGWDPANDWQGFAAAEDLPRALDPPEQFLATANDDLNALGRVHPINQCFGPYRAERIRQVLAQSSSLTIDDMARLQLDVYSLQAERFLAILRPLLADAEPHDRAKILADWDLRYDADSEGAFLFEQFYRALVDEVFGGPHDSAELGDSADGAGEPIVSPLLDRTALFAGLFWNFDRVLLSGHSRWFGGRSRDAVYRQALQRALRARPRPYGQGRGFRLRHLLFGGKLPRRLGFDRGPITLPGGRATVLQGQIYDDRGQEVVIGPSFRFLTDLSTDEAHTALPGGPSDRRFSRWYASDLLAWAKGRYKVVRGRDEEAVDAE